MAKIITLSSKNWYGIALLSITLLFYAGYKRYTPASQPAQISQPTTAANLQADELFTQANQLYKEGNYAQASKKYHDALTVDPKHEQAHISASLAAAKLGQTDHAIEHVQKAIALNKNYVAGYVMLGKFQEDKKLFDEAQKSYEKALSLNANLFEANLFLAKLLTRQGTKESISKALDHAQKALAVQPTQKNALLTLADAQLLAGDHAAARSQYQKAIQANPAAHDAYLGLGRTFEYEKNIDSAMHHYRKAIDLKPDYAHAHVALADAYFMRGNVKDGFAEYEWRWKISNMPNLARKWDGTDPAGKRVIVLSENGLGDIIQYVRFAQLLKEKGAYVILHTPPALKELFSGCHYADQVVVSGESTPEYDLITSMQSIPYLLNISQKTLPAKKYLAADTKLINSWRNRLTADHNFKIGICWQSGNDSHLGLNQKRSIDLSLFASIADIPGISLYSLQKDAPNTAPFNITTFNDLDTKNGGFMDSAALIENMDLIISADTSIAHLSGALGKQTWILLPYISDARWELNGEKSIWYPSAQLFRQSKPGDWKQVIETIKKNLLEKMES